MVRPTRRSGSTPASTATWSPLVASKDSDFRQLAFLHGPPPKVLWLRVGNSSTATVLQLILDHVEVVEAFVGTEDEALLVLPSLRST